MEGHSRQLADAGSACRSTDSACSDGPPALLTVHLGVRVQVTVQYNLCSEPWVKYSMAGVADRGLPPNLWTSARLHHSVLYLETHRCARSATDTPSYSQPYTAAG